MGTAHSTCSRTPPSLPPPSSIPASVFTLSSTPLEDRSSLSFDLPLYATDRESNAPAIVTKVLTELERIGHEASVQSNACHPRESIIVTVNKEKLDEVLVDNKVIHLIKKEKRLIKKETNEGPDEIMDAPTYEVLWSLSHQTYLFQLILDKLSGLQRFSENQALLLIFAHLIERGLKFTVLDFFAYSNVHQTEEEAKKVEVLRFEWENERRKKKIEQEGKKNVLRITNGSTNKKEDDEERFIPPRHSYFGIVNTPPDSYGMRPYFTLDDTLFAHCSFLNSADTNFFYKQNTSNRNDYQTIDPNNNNNNNNNNNDNNSNNNNNNNNNSNNNNNNQWGKNEEGEKKVGFLHGGYLRWERKIWLRLHSCVWGSYIHQIAPHLLTYLTDEDKSDLPMDVARIIFRYVTEAPMPL